MLSFLRNPEIKKMLMWHSVICVVLCLICLFTKPFLIWFCLGVSLLWNCLFFMFQYRRYRNIAALNQSLDTILFTEKTLSLETYKEGELSILSTNIEKLLSRLQDKQNLLAKDKQFLADSIADISHQIRTPLASLQLLVNNYHLEENPQLKQEILRKIYRNLDRMNRLIENLLILSKLDAGTLKMNLQTVPVESIVDKSLHSLEINLELKNISVQKAVQGQLICDEFWMTEAITNLIKNAIEHTPENGQITIESQTNPLFTELRIVDTGPGISPQDLPHIFDRFYRGENANPNSIGIGLALAKQIIHANYGEIKAGNHAHGAYFQIRFYQQIV